jgi:hypothetical protein
MPHQAIQDKRATPQVALIKIFFFDAVAFGGETISQLLHHQGTGSPGGKN